MSEWTMPTKQPKENNAIYRCSEWLACWMEPSSFATHKHPSSVIIWRFPQVVTPFGKKLRNNPELQHIAGTGMRNWDQSSCHDLPSCPQESAGGKFLSPNHKVSKHVVRSTRCREVQGKGLATLSSSVCKRGFGTQVIESVMKLLC